MYDQRTTIGQFLEAAAAKQPTPGGGSVTALVGALATAMGEMTVNYSIGKKGLEPHQSKFAAALEELTRARHLLLQLMIEDQGAYEAMTAARKLPETDPQRQGRFDAALVACIRVPQAMAATAVAVLELADRVADFVNPHLLSDLAVSTDLAMATVRCAICNIRANLPELKDAKDMDALEDSARDMMAHAIALIQRVWPRIWKRHEKEMAG